MKIYMVGGAVRDKVMGVTPKDIDYVVVGSSPEEMLALGYEQVGASFPVFLKNGEEYALARQERKTGVGYNGFETVFDPTITLEDDLIRRDLTINAMAMDLDTGEIIDPYGGRHDIAQGVLRHTSEAFAEDPVRVLRTARFAARYGFKVAEDTIEMMKRVVDELDHVPQERVWTEIEKGLTEQDPVRMFEVLQRCNGLATKALGPYAGYNKQALARVCDKHSLSVRFMVIALGFMDEDYETARIPSRETTLSRTFNRLQGMMTHYLSLDKSDRLYVLEQTRSFNDPDMLEACLQAFLLTTHDEDVVFNILTDRARALTVDAGAIAASCSTGTEIRDMIRAARIQALG
jgi:tRNA nucleotidyltransferase (CCA-adding enzyme)